MYAIYIYIIVKKKERKNIYPLIARKLKLEILSLILVTETQLTELTPM